jgi:hypothetical protein
MIVCFALAKVGEKAGVMARAGGEGKITRPQRMSVG